MKSIWAILAMACALAVHADVRFGEKTNFHIATVDEGRAVLTKSDEFTQAMSAFDRQGRLKTDQDVSEEQFLKFAGTNVLELKGEDIGKVEKALEALKPKIEPLHLPLPERIQIIKTTGNEEAENFYARGNSIVIPESRLRDLPAEQLEHALAHEIFHMVTRSSPELREKLYGAIGFRKCAELKFPPSLMRLTNPDSPHYDHYIEVQANGQTFKGIPVTTARPQKYDLKKGGDIYTYLRFKLLVVTIEGDKPTYDPAKLQMTDTRSLKSYHDQIGANTGYVFHPEEILAENFALLVEGGKDAKTPELLEKIREILTGKGKGN